MEKRGGRDSFYAIDYAARMAMEMGADIVKLNFPKLDPEKAKDSPAPYNEMDVTPDEAVRQIVESAGRSLVVLSGGSKTDDETVLSHTRTIMEAGGSGVIFGRNVWQREWSEALEIAFAAWNSGRDPIPSHSSSTRAVGLTKSPQTLSRGKASRSSNITSRPALARSAAVAEPAGPAPTTATWASSCRPTSASNTSQPGGDEPAQRAVAQY